MNNTTTATRTAPNTFQVTFTDSNGTRWATVDVVAGNEADATRFGWEMVAMNSADFVRTFPRTNSGAPCTCERSMMWGCTCEMTSEQADAEARAFARMHD